MKVRGILVGIIVFLGLAAACLDASSPVPEVKTAVLKVATKADWEQEWDTVLAEAKREGVVALYTLWVPEIRVALTKAFKAKYGIDLEISPFSRGSDLVAKVQAEQRAGLYLADVFGAGSTTFISEMKPVSLLGPIEPFLMLPDVKEPKQWVGGQFPFVDKEKLLIVMMFSKQSDIVYNTSLVKEGEITTYKDVLKPQYKGKITLSDPTVTGVGNGLIGHLALNIWNPEEAKEFLRQLIRQQEIVIQRDDRINVEAVARGKFAIGLAARNPILEEFLRAGAPLGVVTLKEGTNVQHGSSALALPTRRPHANASTVFLNWLLTKEGQTLFSQGFGSPSLRADVSPEGIFPIFLTKPGEKLYLDYEDNVLFRGKLLEVAKQVIDEAQK